ncbi:hypothetical protein GBA65_06930 [Rubrobacter marinus]|uniref:Uncharacterized protein n=1 Tax=Rubrobacter marinus TaxID=2653852 RepID=A0A6G8PVQ5_9ACTN|nr:hypothetical protein [Rubrobacter marinus]QIN78289.1 hypothetical protein GBA65_06930 [Rubrobacter marinus]
MSVRGKESTAREVENGFRLDQGAEERFASLCNAVAWAESRKRARSLPSFTERVKAKDFGIDAEWDTEVADGEDKYPLLGPGWNVYQYKMRDLSTTGRDKLISGLVSDLAGGSKKEAALADLYERTGRRPDRYVLFTNLDLTHRTVKEGEKGQKEKLKDAILDGYDDPEGVRVEIVGAAELAASLNGLPHVRAAYFGGSRFSTAQEELARHEKVGGLPERIALVGRDAESDRLRSFLEDPEARAMFISGSQDMGKSRIALEVTSAERPVDTVVALRPSDLGRDDLAALRSPGNEVVVLVEDPEVAVADKLLEEALGGEGVKLLVTLPTAEDEPVPGYDRGDARVRHMQLGPLDDEDAKRLLKEAGASLSYAVERWVITRTGGNPGILLAAAEAGPDLQSGGAASLAQQVARSFEGRVRRDLGEDALRALEVLSVLSLTGVRGDARAEIAAVVAALGDGPSVNAVLRELDRLEDASLVRMRGNYAEVTPPFFTNHLAARAFLGRDNAPAALLDTLVGDSRARLLERLRSIHGEVATRFWEGLFEREGPLRNLRSVSENLHLLVPAAAAMPEKAARLIEKSLSELDLEARRQVGGEVRRQIVYALQELLARERTAEAALRALAMLVEAENEDYGNNATGVFSESFRPIHPLVALPLDRRLGFLRRMMLDSGESIGVRKAAAGAASEGLSMRGMVLYQGGGAEPLEGSPAMTYGEAWDYFDGLVALLMEASRSEERPLAEVAGELLPRTIADSALQARPEKAVERMEEVVRSALRHEAPIPVPELLSQVERVERRLNGMVKAHEANTDDERAVKRAEELRARTKKLEGLRTRIEQGDFRIQLERWAGPWASGGVEMVDDGSGGKVFRYVDELRRLAKEAAENPGKLSDEVLSWAIYSSEEQKRGAFFRVLGEFDSARVWQRHLEQAGKEKDAAIAFASYFGGLGEEDASFAGERLDALAATGIVTEEALFRATVELSDGESAVARVERLAGGQAIDPFYVRVLLFGRWVETLGSNRLKRLLSTLAGPKLENALAVVKAASYWQDGLIRRLGKRPTNFLWKCLEAARTQSIYDVIECDRLAAELARQNPDRGFALLEHLLRRPYRFGDWDPAGPDHQELWKALCEADRQRALRTVLSLAAENRQMMFAVSMAFTGVLDQKRDADVLLDAAVESRGQAEVVAHMLNAAQPGFWPLALQLLECYPQEGTENEVLHGELLDSSIYSPVGTVNPEGAELIKILEQSFRELSGLLQADKVPKALRSLIEEYLAHLRRKIEQDLLSEAAEEAEVFRSGTLVEPKDADEAKDRLFAVRRMLESDRFALARRVLSRDELLRLLPKLKFSQEEEARLRQELEHSK